MNKNINYFSHDANARRDPKVMRMTLKYKYGYQWYFQTLEILRVQTEYKYLISDSDLLAKELSEPKKKISEWINDCINVYKLFESDTEYFFSVSLVNRMSIMEQKSKTYSENAKKRHNQKKPKANEEPFTNDSLAIAEPLHSNCNTNKEIKEINKEIDIGSESEKVIWVNPSPYYTIEQCISTAEYEGYKKEEGEKFYNHYSAQGWKRGAAGLLITDLVSAFRSWIDKGKESNKKLARETWEDKQRKKSI